MTVLNASTILSSLLSTTVLLSHTTNHTLLAGHHFPALSSPAPSSTAKPDHHSCNNESGLFLTKYIKHGQLDKARELSEDIMNQFHLKVSTNSKLTSFSGYLTVDEKYNSNIFFWFFPALERPETAPVVMWTSESTGFSSIKGLFLDNGPFYLDEDGELRDRDVSWVKTHSMLYIDAPVGTGFSFTDKEGGYAKNTNDYANEVYEALSQFFTLFKEYQDRDFYIAGELAAADIAPRLVSVIHNNNNRKGAKVNIKVKGLILGAAIFNLPLQLHFANYFYNMGLVGKEQKKTIAAAEKNLQVLIKQKKFEEAYEVLTTVVFFPNDMYQRFSGLNETRAVTSSKPLSDINRFRKFVDSNQFHSFLPAGLHKFSLINWKVHDQFSRSTISLDGSAIGSIMDKGYRVLIYAGQMDPIAVHPGVAKATAAIRWSGAGEYKKVKRRIWKVEGDVAGYAKETLCLTYVLVRNTGRYLMMDSPEWGLDLLNRFTSGRRFAVNGNRRRCCTEEDSEEDIPASSETNREAEDSPSSRPKQPSTPRGTGAKENTLPAGKEPARVEEEKQGSKPTGPKGKNLPVVKDNIRVEEEKRPAPTNKKDMPKRKNVPDGDAKVEEEDKFLI